MHTQTPAPRLALNETSLRLAVMRLRKRLGRSPRPTEIADELDSSPETVVEWVARRGATRALRPAC